MYQPDWEKCGACGGCGQVVTKDDGGLDPWFAWADLPPGSNIAVMVGLVSPSPCPNGCPIDPTC